MISLLSGAEIVLLLIAIVAVGWYIGDGIRWLRRWFMRWVEAAKDQDKFWREWHRERRQKRMAYWEEQRRKHLLRAFSAGRMAQYFRDRI